MQLNSKRPTHIYLITNSINGKKYVGQTVKKPSERFSQHKSKARGGYNTPLYTSMRKYGFDNFSVKTLLVCERQFADYYEEGLINTHESWVSEGKGYNIKQPETPSNLNPTKGETHGCSQLTERNVIDIISSFDLSPSKAAIKYNISESSIYAIRSGRLWKHLDVDRYPVDCYATNPRPSGEQHHNSKLSNLERELIRNDDITPTGVLALRYQIDRHTITNLRGAKTHIPKCNGLREREAQFILDNPEISNKELSEKLDVSKQFVADVKRRKTYTYLISNATPSQWYKYSERQQQMKNQIQKRKVNK